MFRDTHTTAAHSVSISTGARCAGCPTGGAVEAVPLGVCVHSDVRAENLRNDTFLRARPRPQAVRGYISR